MTGDTKTVFQCYHEVAQYYQTLRDHKSSIYFYEKCLEFARLTSNVEAEMDANHFLGLTYSITGENEKAIKFHEKHLSLAETRGYGDETVRAQKELV